MGNDLIELNDMELNYIYFGDDTDSNDLVTIGMKTLHCKKAYFILNGWALFELLK